MTEKKYDVEKGLDYEGYPLLLVYHLDHKEVVYIKRDGYYPDINRMVNLENR
jgi:hypothetical protein